MPPLKGESEHKVKKKSLAASDYDIFFGSFSHGYFSDLSRDKSFTAYFDEHSSSDADESQYHACGDLDLIAFPQSRETLF
jgi:hypothetical protein